MAGRGWGEWGDGAGDGEGGVGTAVGGGRRGDGMEGVRPSAVGEASFAGFGDGDWDQVNVRVVVVFERGCVCRFA